MSKTATARGCQGSQRFWVTWAANLYTNTATPQSYSLNVSQAPNYVPVPRFPHWRVTGYYSVQAQYDLYLQERTDDGLPLGGRFHTALNTGIIPLDVRFSDAFRAHGTLVLTGRGSWTGTAWYPMLQLEGSSDPFSSYLPPTLSTREHPK